jgi:hypothetical protein
MDLPGAATATDTRADTGVRTLFGSVTDILSALQDSDGARVDLTEFLNNPTFSWRRYVQWQDLSHQAVECCAAMLLQEGVAQKAEHAKILFNAGVSLGTRQLCDVRDIEASAGNHWIPDGQIDPVKSERWFCSICYNPNIAQLRQAIVDAGPNRVINYVVTLDMLDASCFIRSHCDAILHNGTYTHRQNAAAAAGAGTATATEPADPFRRALKESSATIATFGLIMQATLDELRQLKLAVEKKSD